MASEEEKGELMVQEITRQAHAKAVAEAILNKKKHVIILKLRLVNRELEMKIQSLG